jgi:hypothetical protein
MGKCFRSQIAWLSALVLVVYVDDFLLVGEKKSVDIGWTKIRTVVKLGDTGPLGHFLGCAHDVSKSTNADGSVKSIVSFNMQGYLEQAVKDYRAAAEDSKPFYPVDSFPYRRPFTTCGRRKSWQIGTSCSINPPKTSLCSPSCPSGLGFRNQSSEQAPNEVAHLSRPCSP